MLAALGRGIRHAAILQSECFLRSLRRFDGAVRLAAANGGNELVKIMTETGVLGQSKL